MTSFSSFVGVKSYLEYNNEDKKENDHSYLNNYHKHSSVIDTNLSSPPGPGKW